MERKENISSWGNCGTKILNNSEWTSFARAGSHGSMGRRVEEGLGCLAQLLDGRL